MVVHCASIELSHFFRASLWWKYLDHSTVLPPPFTFIFLLYSASRSCWRRLKLTKDQFSEDTSLYDRSSVVTNIKIVPKMTKYKY